MRGHNADGVSRCLPGCVVLALAAVSVLAGCGGKNEPAQQAAGGPAAAGETHYQPSVLEWRNYIATLDRYRRTGGEDQLGQPVRSSSEAEFVPTFDRSLVAFEPLPTEPSNWLRIFNSFDFAVGVQINGMPMGTLKAGGTYLIPVPEKTEHVIEFFVPETDVFRRDREPMRLVSRYVLQVG